MKATKGIQLLKPLVNLPWGIDIKSCAELVGKDNLEKETDGCYKTKCQWLNKEPEVLLLKFSSNGLYGAELHRTSKNQDTKAFKRRRASAEGKWGNPTSTELEYYSGPESAYWLMAGAKAYHQFYYKFGFVEKLGIEKT